jgi:hypothetical protein
MGEIGMEWMVLMLRPAYFITNNMSMGEAQRLWLDAMENGMSDHDLMKLMHEVCALNHFGEANDNAR